MWCLAETIYHTMFHVGCYRYEITDMSTKWWKANKQKNKSKPQLSAVIQITYIALILNICIKNRNEWVKCEEEKTICWDDLVCVRHWFQPSKCESRMLKKVPMIGINNDTLGHYASHLNNDIWPVVDSINTHISVIRNPHAFIWDYFVSVVSC